MGYPGRKVIYEATIRRMVGEAIQEEEAAFRTGHETDTDEALLDYLKRCAAHLHHTPWPMEVVGGSYLAERFGSWQEALSRAGLSEPTRPNRPETFRRIIGETERQRECYRQRKAEKKLLAQERRQRQYAKKKPK